MDGEADSPPAQDLAVEECLVWPVRELAVVVRTNEAPVVGAVGTDIVAKELCWNWQPAC